MKPLVRGRATKQDCFCLSFVCGIYVPTRLGGTAELRLHFPAMTLGQLLGTSVYLSQT